MRKSQILIAILIGMITLGFADKNEGFDRYDIPYKNEKRLEVDLDFAFGSLNIRPSENNDYIMRAGMNYSQKKLKPTFIYKTVNSKGKLNLGTTNTKNYYSFKDFNRMKKDSETNIWRLEFIKNLSTIYNIEFGAGEGDLDFSGMTIESMNFELAMGDVELFFNEPNKRKMKSMDIETGLGSFEARGLGYANISDFSLECGLGSSFLVFDGDFEGVLKGEVSVGLGSVDIEIPRDIAVEIRSESSFLSSVSFEDFDKIDSGLYRSENWGTNTRAKMILEIAVGMGSANITWID